MTDIVGAVKQLKLERDALLAENLDLKEAVRREQSRRHTAERRAREWRAKHNSLIKDAAQLVKAGERCSMGEAKLKAHLSMVRHVAQNHGGTVLVESREGEGSTFTLELSMNQ